MNIYVVGIRRIFFCKRCWLPLLWSGLGWGKKRDACLHPVV